MKNKTVALLMVAYIGHNNGMENLTQESSIKKKTTSFCCDNDNDDVDDDKENTFNVFESLSVSIEHISHTKRSYLKICFQENQNLRKDMGGKITLHFEDKNDQAMDNCFLPFKDTKNFIKSGTKLNKIKSSIFSIFDSNGKSYSLCIVPGKNINYKTINIYLSCEGSEKKIYLNKAQDVFIETETIQASQKTNNNYPTEKSDSIINNSQTEENTDLMPNSQTIDNNNITTTSPTDTFVTSIVEQIIGEKLQVRKKGNYYTITFPEVKNILSIKNKIHIHIADEDGNPVNKAFTNYDGGYEINDNDKVTVVKKTFLKTKNEKDRSMTLKCIKKFEGEIYFTIEGDETHITVPNL
ncbi:MAG: hypothetical protein II393_03180 [Cytophagales bacterium]|nr:hypothetical protein [Cytophagales bacterium]